MAKEHWHASLARFLDALAELVKEGTKLLKEKSKQ